MRIAPGPGALLGYCTNVHAGASMAETLSNLERFALAVKADVCPDRPMPVGLWLADTAVSELTTQDRSAELASWLDDRGLFPFTLNGFPFSDFHRPVVKHRVYEPDWTTQARTLYTIELSRIHARLLGEGGEGSISTLPLGWRSSLAARPEAVEQAARNLLCVAEHLREIEERTGRLIHLDLEPEPGCFLSTSSDVVRFFKEHLLGTGVEALVRRYIRVCHDVCHAAVMFEGQAEAFRRYRAEGIAIGKVQLSSALRVRFDRLGDDERRAARESLGRFAEPRYLHQTTIRSGDVSTDVRFFEDLSEALEAHASVHPGGEWRVHFHVPLFAERFGPVESTSDQLREALSVAGEDETVRHFEVETYAWGVLPAEFGCGDLAAGIAREITWVREQTTA